MAYLITDGGSSWATLHVRDVDSGQDLSDALVGVHGSLSSVAWASDGSGLFYERFDLPEPGAERTAQMTGEGILFHRLGETQEQDRLVFDTPDRPGASLSHSVSDDGRYLVVATTDGATQHNQLHYRDLTRADAPIVPLVSEADAMFRFIGNRGSAFWIWTTLDAPKGRVVSVDLGSPARATWQVLVPEADEAISSWIGATAVGTT